jgi:hypothetical protein
MREGRDEGEGERRAIQVSRSRKKEKISSLSALK